MLTAFFSIEIFLNLYRCQEFLNYIDTYFLIDDKSSSRSELINRVLLIENQLTEYNQTINRDINNVNEIFIRYFLLNLDFI